jgi:hypothetical protein
VQRGDEGEQLDAARSSEPRTPGARTIAICARLRRCPGALELDETRNTRDGGARVISTDVSRLQAWVIPTDEELLIARDTARLLTPQPPGAGPAAVR